jgi:hypothetical protein
MKIIFFFCYNYLYDIYKARVVLLMDKRRKKLNLTKKDLKKMCVFIRTQKGIYFIIFF